MKDLLRFLRFLTLACLGCGHLCAASSDACAAPPDATGAPGLGEPGALTSLEMLALGEGVLRGPDARKQLIVDGCYASGQRRDLSRIAAYRTAPEGIVAIDSSGFVVPLANGQVEVTVADSSGLSAKTHLTVERFDRPLPVNFPNHITPIFTKHGCNAGGCHGKASGQNGFRLSLLGFYPSDDYEYLVKEARGRRLFRRRPSAACSC